jgi:hypothetical protein
VCPGREVWTPGIPAASRARYVTLLFHASFRANLYFARCPDHLQHLRRLSLDPSLAYLMVVHQRRPVVTSQSYRYNLDLFACHENASREIPLRRAKNEKNRRRVRPILKVRGRRHNAEHERMCPSGSSPPRVAVNSRSTVWSEASLSSFRAL